MPGLVNDFGHVHLEPNAHHFGHDMHKPTIQLVHPPPGYSNMPDPRSFLGNSKPPIGYIGYTFTKHPAEHPGQKETWAIVNKELMPASQADLKNQIEKRRKRGVTGLDQYTDPEMKGFKQKQIDELIRQCIAMDPDRRFEYNIASIRRDTKRRRQGGTETSTMHVILKRQPRADIDMQGPFIGFGNLHFPLSGLVDLSGAEESEKWSHNSSNGHKSGAYPFARHLSEPWVHVAHPNERPPAHRGHSYEDGHPHGLGDPHGHGHGDHDNKNDDHAHGLEQPLHAHDGHPHPLEDAHEAKHDHGKKAKKPKDKEHKSPKIKHEVHRSHGYHSESSSFSDSDSSSVDTDRTPDTIISSEGSHYHHKDKKYHKDRHHRKSSSHDHDHELPKVTYREHKRKEPTRRLSSPPPAPRSRYRHEDVYIEPAFTSRRRPESFYPRERVPYHHRAMSYDDERLHDHDLRGIGRRPTVYRRRITGTAHPVDLYDEVAERRRHEMPVRDIWEEEAGRETAREAARRRERVQREVARERLDPERIYRPRMERMRGYHDDHLHGYHDNHY